SLQPKCLNLNEVHGPAIVARLRPEANYRAPAVIHGFAANHRQFRSIRRLRDLRRTRGGSGSGRANFILDNRSITKVKVSVRNIQERAAVFAFHSRETKFQETLGPHMRPALLLLRAPEATVA